jgi:hypothetical protein
MADAHNQGGVHFVSCPHAGCERLPGAHNLTAHDGFRPVPAALSFAGCARISILDCNFRHIGQTAVAFTGGAHQADPQTPGSRDSTVGRCNFTDISCSAVQLRLGRTVASEKELPNMLVDLV